MILGHYNPKLVKLVETITQLFMVENSNSICMKAINKIIAWILGTLNYDDI